MAKVSKRGDRPGAPWQVRWVDPEGAQRKRSFPRKADADAFATEVDHRKRSGLYVDPSAGRVTFREYAEAWRAVQPHRATTAEQLENRLRLHVYPLIGHRPLAAIRPTELQALVRDREKVLAPATVTNVVAWVSTIFRAAVDDRIITTSPATRLGRRRRDAPSSEVVVFSIDEVAALHAAMPESLRAAVLLGAGAGLRSGEMLGLTVDRVDFLRRSITVDRQLITTTGSPPMHAPPKTAAGVRTIPVPDELLVELSEHIARFPVTDEVGFLFRSSSGDPIRRNRWGATWARAVADAGLAKGTRFHALRHTYASALIAAGLSVKVIQARLGHATAQETLDTYGHLWPDDEDRTRVAIGQFLARSPQDRPKVVATP